MATSVDGGHRRPRTSRAARTAAPEDTREYPLVEVQDGPGPYKVQLFPRESVNAMSVGYVPRVVTEQMKSDFETRVRMDAEFYEETGNTPPEFVAGRVYLSSYFGVLHGPLGSDPEDSEAVIAEAISMFGVANVDDQRATA